MLNPEMTDNRRDRQPEKLESPLINSRNSCSCDYNRHVECILHSPCSTCGWNPEVSSRRIEALKNRIETERLFRNASGWR